MNIYSEMVVFLFVFNEGINLKRHYVKYMVDF